MLSTIILAAEEAPATLILPAWGFPLIAAIVFIFLAIVVHSYRDVANRHSQKTGGDSGHAADGHAADHHAAGHH